ncbi:MAG: hypothetical protein AAB284_02255, partial [Chloroflexota bacterium]
SKTIIGDLVGSTGHMAFDEDLNAGRTFTLAAADDESAAARRLRFIEQDLNASADEAGELSGAPGTAAIDDGGVSGGSASVAEDSAAQRHLRMVEQDLDAGQSVDSTPSDIEPTEY